MRRLMLLRVARDIKVPPSFLELIDTLGPAVLVRSWLALALETRFQ
jgi:hypothetical protein